MVMSLTCFVLWAHIITIVIMLTEMSFNMVCDTHGHDSAMESFDFGLLCRQCIAAKEEGRDTLFLHLKELSMVEENENLMKNFSSEECSLCTGTSQVYVCKSFSKLLDVDSIKEDKQVFISTARIYSVFKCIV